MGRREIRELYDYNLLTGRLTHAVDKPGRGRNYRRKGTPAEWFHAKGHLECQHGKVHRVAFMYVLGWVPEEVDHINGDNSDNRWINLRPANREVNCRNTALRSDNSSGHSGISWCAPRGMWRLQIGQGSGKPRLGGHFNTLEEAIFVRDNIMSRLGYTERHGK